MEITPGSGIGEANISEAVTPQPIQHKNTTVGKTVRTFLQACVGMISVTAPVLIANEDFRKYLSNNPEWSWILIVLPAVIALATYIQNSLDPTVPNTVKDKTV